MRVPRNTAANRFARLLSLPALIIALACQLALGAADLPDQADDAWRVQAIGVMCLSHPASDQAPAAPHRHQGVPAFCTFAGAFAHAGLLPVPIVAAPIPLPVAIRFTGPASIRAPPSQAFRTAYPTGPPAV
jgi:hypothetical protein